MIVGLNGLGNAVEFLCLGEPASPQLSNRNGGASDCLMVSNLVATSSGPAEWLLEASSVIRSRTLRSKGFCVEDLGKFRGVVGVVN